MFGVSFATLKTLMKRIDVDHELALALWDTRNFDARNLAVKIVDPTRMTSADLDRWGRETSAPRLGVGYVAMIAAEGPHSAKKAAQWLASSDDKERCHGWRSSHSWRGATRRRLMRSSRNASPRIVRTIHAAPNAEREGMNLAVIAIGCRSPGLRKTATAAAKRIGKVEVDHGDTACKTPGAAEYIEKSWTHAASKRFESPAAQERSRETPRSRC